MMIPLDKADYGRVRSLCTPLNYHLCCAAVLDGHNPGKVWVDDPADPQTAFIYSPEASYLAGDATNEAFNRALSRAIHEHTIAAHLYALGFVVHPASWEERLPSILAPQALLQVARRHYICRRLKYDWRTHLPDEYTVHPIDEALLGNPQVRIPDHVKSWMEGNWGSTAAFLHGGFGMVTVHNDPGAQQTIVSWSLADCRSGDACEIGIHTLPDYRRRGLATITAAATVEYALSHGYSTVGWQCSEDNPGSFGTAEKVGFEMERHYKMYDAFMDKG